MPHTNRKKKSSAANGGEKPQLRVIHTKRQQVEDADGWTHVIDSPRRTSAKKGKDAFQVGDFEKDGVSYVRRTLEEIKKDGEYYQKQWESSEAHKVLNEKLGEAQGRRKVGNVVVLGLGSLQSARREGRRASYTQLAALQTIISVLGNGQPLPCVLQDPQFTDLDKEFFSSLGWNILEDPEAFGKITEESLVYAIHCYADVYRKVSEGPRPAVLVGTDVGNFGRFSLSEKADAIATSLEEMVKDCHAIECPQVRHDFSDTKIYWRRDPDSVKEEVETPAVESITAAAETAPKRNDAETAPDSVKGGEEGTEKAEESK